MFILRNVTKLFFCILFIHSLFTPLFSVTNCNHCGGCTCFVALDSSYTSFQTSVCELLTITGTADLCEESSVKHLKNNLTVSGGPPGMNLTFTYSNAQYIWTYSGSPTEPGLYSTTISVDYSYDFGGGRTFDCTKSVTFNINVSCGPACSCFFTSPASTCFKNGVYSTFTVSTEAGSFCNGPFDLQLTNPSSLPSAVTFTQDPDDSSRGTLSGTAIIPDGDIGDAFKLNFQVTCKSIDEQFNVTESVVNQSFNLYVYNSKIYKGCGVFDFSIPTIGNLSISETTVNTNNQMIAAKTANHHSSSHRNHKNIQFKTIIKFDSPKDSSNIVAYNIYQTDHAHGLGTVLLAEIPNDHRKHYRFERITNQSAKGSKFCVYSISVLGVHSEPVCARIKKHRRCFPRMVSSRNFCEENERVIQMVE